MGETTLAAVLVAMVARMMTIIDSTVQNRAVDLADQPDGIGNGLADELSRGRGQDHAQAREHQHRERQADDLPDDLALL
mgnify:CR=1 FL=1